MSRYNKRELGLYVANQLLSHYLDPLSNLVEFQRPATTARGAGGRATTATMQQNNINNTNNSYYNSLSMKRSLINSDKSSLPKFILPKTISMNLPGGLLYVRSSLPVVNEFETTDLVTGDMSTDRITVVVVSEKKKDKNLLKPLKSLLHSFFVLFCFFCCCLISFRWIYLDRLLKYPSSVEIQLKNEILVDS